MARLAKFRALGTSGMKDGFWCFGFYYKQEHLHYGTILENGILCAVNESTLGQFTGLLDKNGKEIYEGDILNIGASSFGFIHDNDGKNSEYEVQVNGCDFILFRKDLKLKWGRLSRIDELGWECEVIGNIYEPKKS